MDPLAITTPPQVILTISFSDNTQITMTEDAAKKIEVIGLSLQHNMKECREKTFMCHCSQKAFQAARAIVTEYQSLDQVLTAEQKRDPFIFEKLCTDVGYLYPSKVVKIGVQLMDQLANMPLQQARDLMKDEIARDNSNRLLPPPSLDRTQAKESIYFTADENSEAICNANTPSAIKRLKNSPLKLQNAASHLLSSDGEIQYKAWKARHLLKNYRTIIVEGLKESSADISQKKLLEHIVGPKNYLLSHYGLVYLKNAHDPQKPFRYIPALRHTATPLKQTHMATSKPFGCLLKESTAQELENTIRKDILRAFPQEVLPEPCVFSEATDVLERLCDATQKTLDKPETEVPLALAFAHKKVQQALYFSSDAEVTELLEKMHEKMNEIVDLRGKIALETEETKRQDLQKSKAKAKAELFEYEAALTSRKQSPEGKSCVSRHCTDPYFQAKTSKVHKLFTSYTQTIINLLERSGADMSRTDLLEYLVGPKGFLFARYGLTPEDQNSNSLCFVPGLIGQCASERQNHMDSKTHFYYSLGNLGPKDLEEEIRRDLQVAIERASTYHELFVIKELPPAIITHSEITRVLTPQQEHLRSLLLPVASEWPEIEEDKKRTIFQALLEINHWEQYGITTDHLFASGIKKSERDGIVNLLKKFSSQINVDQKKEILNTLVQGQGLDKYNITPEEILDTENLEDKPAEEIVTLKGYIKKSGWPKTHFYFNTYDGQLLIGASLMATPDTQSTHSYLQQLAQTKKEPFQNI